MEIRYTEITEHGKTNTEWSGLNKKFDIQKHRDTGVRDTEVSLREHRVWRCGRIEPIKLYFLHSCVHWRDRSLWITVFVTRDVRRRRARAHKCVVGGGRWARATVSPFAYD